jgi:hypothetical protein
VKFIKPLKLVVETPLIKTIQTAPKVFSCWTPEGLKKILGAFYVKSIDIVAGSASGLAW